MEKARIETGKSFHAQLLANGMDFSKIRNNDLLQKDEWADLDAALVKVAKNAINIAADLKAAGLVRNLGGLGTVIAQYETLSDMTAAELSVSGVTESEGDTPEYDLRSVLVPIISKDFFFSIRRLMASRKMGEPLDTSAVEVATRLVMEAVENMIFNGSVITSGTATIPGVFTYADSMDVGAPTGAWTTTPANIFTDVNRMLGRLDAVGHLGGSFALYLSNDIWTATRQDAKANGSDTVLERLLAYPEISAVKSSSQVASGSAALIHMVPETIQLAIGEDVKVVEWNTQGGMRVNFKVLAACAPIIKSDANGNCGICYIDGLS